MPVTSEFRYLGSGSEGFVYESGGYIFKYIPDISSLNLLFLKTHICNSRKIRCLRPVLEIRNTETMTVLISPNQHCTPYCGGDEDGILNILADAYRNRYVCRNIKPSNLMYTEDGILQITDIGADIVPFSDSLYRNMAERAFLTATHTNDPQLSVMMSRLHTPFRSIDECRLNKFLSILKKNYDI